MKDDRATKHTTEYSRRAFLAGVAWAVSGAGCATYYKADAPEVIDCHTHFYDPTRKQGVPWPAPGEKELYRRVLPSDYMRVAQPLGITGTVVVEASDWVTDNEWLLDLSKREPFIRGVVGNLPVGERMFAEHLGRLARNPLFKGIRLRGQSMSRINEEAVIRDLILLAGYNLSLDVNGGPESLNPVAKLARKVPELRIIINHVGNLRIDGNCPPESWINGMRAAAAHPNVYCKVSGLVEGSGKHGGGRVGIDHYKPVLDHVWLCFGEKRVIYGSNWPVSEMFADLKAVHSIVSEYFGAKSGPALRNVLAGNSRRFYGWT